MTDFLGHSPNGMGLANTAILASLFDHLLARQILKSAEVVSILDSARRELGKNGTIISVQDAVSIVSKLSATYQNIEP
jgi:hypothetical protein